MLRFTACLFATVVLHAYAIRHVVYHHLFLAVTVLSILFHCTRLEWVGRLDWLVAHLAFAIVTSDILSSPQWATAAVWPLMVALCWGLECPHALLHLVAVLGLHCWLRVATPSRA